MNREEMINRLESDDFEVLVIGGGATGLGVAIDAASRGYRTALVEAHDFAKGTSGRSTKLIHGGVRYLEQLNFSLVMEALRERGILYRNAPHLVTDLSFVVPRYRWWEGPFYGIGMKLYDALAGRLNLAPSQILDRDETIQVIPNIERDDLMGGVRYHDGQFDDARMAMTLALTAVDHGAVIANYTEVTRLLKERGQITGVEALDKERDRVIKIRSKTVVNATGIFADSIRRLDKADSPMLIEPSQGIHLVFDRSFQPSDSAIMVPHTDDGRVLFVIPWNNRVLIGTTDTPMTTPEFEPRALDEEVEFIFRNASRYLDRDPGIDDVKSVFAGQRPLVHPGGVAMDSKSISRSHEVFTSESGLVSIVGGKWTTYRKMAEDAMACVIQVGNLEERPCITENLRLHGYLDREDPAMPEDYSRRVYGAEAAGLNRLEKEEPEFSTAIHDRLPYKGAEVVWAARREMARTVEDVLSRRTRSLIIDAAASIEAAPLVAKLLASELGYDKNWERQQVGDYVKLAKGYLPDRQG